MLAILAACASNKEIAEAKAEYRERFLAEKQRCLAQGGVMVMDGHVSRDVPPTGTAYRCAR